MVIFKALYIPVTIFSDLLSKSRAVYGDQSNRISILTIGRLPLHKALMTEYFRVTLTDYVKNES